MTKHILAVLLLAATSSFASAEDLTSKEMKDFTGRDRRRNDSKPDGKARLRQPVGEGDEGAGRDRRRNDSKPDSKTGLRQPVGEGNEGCPWRLEVTLKDPQGCR